MASRQNLSHAFEIQGGDFGKAGCVSLEIKEILRDLGIDSAIVRRAAIAAYEAEMNVVMYADSATVMLRLNPQGIKIALDDKGPGIHDIELAMQEGYSTATDQMREMGFGAGMGLPNIKGNADSFQLKSTIGKGTSYKIFIDLGSEEKT